MTCFAITRSASPGLLFAVTPEFCSANVPNVARVNTVVVAPLGGVASAAPTTRARVLTPSTTRNIARLIVVVLSSSPWPTRPLVSSSTLPVSSFHKGAGLVGPATLYNAATVTSMRYQAHPPNGLSLYAMWLFPAANFAELPFHALG